MKFQAAAQIILIVLAVALSFLVIKPKVAEIQARQTELDEYATAIKNAEQYNNKLSELRSRIDNFSNVNKVALDAYLPSDIDSLSVSQDIEAMVSQSGMLLQSIEAGDKNESVTIQNGIQSPVDVMDPAMMVDPSMDPSMGGSMVVGSGLLEEARQGLVSRQFSVSVSGTYDQFKQFLSNLERNAYPMRLEKLEFDVSEDSDLTDFSVTVVTFALNDEEK